MKLEDGVMVKHIESYDPCPDSLPSPRHALGLKPIQIQ